MNFATLSRPFHFVKEYVMLIRKGISTKRRMAITAGAVIQRNSMPRLTRALLRPAVMNRSSYKTAGEPRSPANRISHVHYLEAFTICVYFASSVSKVCCRLVCPAQ